MIEPGESVIMFTTIIGYIFKTTLNTIWSLITSSWILTAFLLMGTIGTLFTWVFPRDEKNGD